MVIHFPNSLLPAKHPIRVPLRIKAPGPATAYSAVSTPALVCPACGRARRSAVERTRWPLQWVKADKWPLTRNAMGSYGELARSSEAMTHTIASKYPRGSNARTVQSGCGVQSGAAVQFIWRRCPVGLVTGVQLVGILYAMLAHAQPPTCGHCSPPRD